MTFHIDSNNFHTIHGGFSSHFSIRAFQGRCTGDGEQRDQRDQRRGPWPRGEVYLGARRSAEAHRHGEVAWAQRGIFFLGNEGYTAW